MLDREDLQVLGVWGVRFLAFALALLMLAGTAGLSVRLFEALRTI